MNEKTPVEVGERVVSMRTWREVVVCEVTCSWGRKWFAHVRTPLGERAIVACSRAGIKGYRRMP